MFEWLTDGAVDLWWVFPLSVLSFFGTIALLPIIVTRMPPDYFMKERRNPFARTQRHWLVHWLLVLTKNVLGVVILTAGLAMLVLPGQGMLTILIGLTLLDFPGKYYLERRIVLQPAILHSVNWIRLRANHPPLQLPAARGEAQASADHLSP
ncbi:MAG: PGPGW domain-containing protein [Pseudomonadota bacterium]|nr:PGPGW domain-containing protein [Pseudomonadota bacterium]